MLLRVSRTFYSSKRFLQALHVSGDKKRGNITILEPVLDFEHRFANRTVLEQNIERRKLESALNVDDLYTEWEMVKTIETKKKALLARQRQVSKLLKEVQKYEQENDKENHIRKYTLEKETIKEDLKNLFEHGTSVEDAFICRFLAIPNDISDAVPNEAQVISIHGEKSTEQRPHHLKFDQVIEFYGKSTYFLKGNAARVDGVLPLDCIDYFRKNGFIQFSNPDFVRTILIEGAGLPLDDFYQVTHHLDQHHTNIVHLVGNSSMLSFLGFVTKLRVAGTLLPLKYVAAGKIYGPQESNKDSLFNVSQSTAVQVFLAGTKDQMQQKFDETLDLMKKLFSSFDVHYRVVRVPANELRPAECSSIRFEMFSPHLNEYIEVANLSNYSDYISKRLLFSFQKDREKNVCEFNHIVSGTVCNVTKLIAILLETNNGNIPLDLLIRNS